MENNHNYERPSVGMTDWHVPINENFAKLDGDVEIRDQEANLSDYTPKTGAKFLALDTENVFIGDGSTWHKLAASGQDPTVNSVSTKHINQEVYASEFDGEGLASKVENALQWIADNTDGQGRVRVTPLDGGGVWTWDTELIIDDHIYEGVHLSFDKNVKINYSGDGTAITLEGGVGEFEPTIEGGRWTFSGNPEGWLRIKDTYGTIVSPTRINDCYNSSGTAFGVSIENHDSWSEYSRIRDAFIRADRPIQFRTADQTGGSGTDSFQETKIRDCHLRGTDYCIRTNGNIRYSIIESTTFRPEANGAKCLYFNHRYMSGSVAQNLKFEDVGGHTDDVAIYDPNNRTWHGPMIISPAFYNMSTEFQGGSSLHYMDYWGEGFHFEWPTADSSVEIGKNGVIEE